jgi:hypothetical protein
MSVNSVRKDLEGAWLTGRLVSLDLKDGTRVENCKVAKWPPSGGEAELVLVNQYVYDEDGQESLAGSHAIDLADVTFLILHSDKSAPS